MEYKPFPTHLNDPRTVTTEYAVTHPDELLKAVNQNNDAIFIRNDNDLAVLVPCWWYMNNFGSNVQRIVERLFKECRTKDIVTAKINLDIAHGFLSHVNQITGQEIQRSLMAKMDGSHSLPDCWKSVHPHALQMRLAQLSGSLHRSPHRPICCPFPGPTYLPSKNTPPEPVK